MPITDTAAAWICQCCVSTAANGECCTDHDVEPLRLLDARTVVALADEVDVAFSWTRCDGCGSTLGGDRFEVTLLYPA